MQLAVLARAARRRPGAANGNRNTAANSGVKPEPPARPVGHQVGDRGREDRLADDRRQQHEREGPDHRAVGGGVGEQPSVVLQADEAGRAGLEAGEGLVGEAVHGPHRRPDGEPTEQDQRRRGVRDQGRGVTPAADGAHGRPCSEDLAGPGSCFGFVGRRGRRLVAGDLLADAASVASAMTCWNLSSPPAAGTSGHRRAASRPPGVAAGRCRAGRRRGRRGGLRYRW